MLDDITQEWVPDIGIQNVSDRELEESRGADTGVSDPSSELHRYVETIIRNRDLDKSQVCDLALRVELAAAIDDRRVAVTREAFDIAYAIPPAGWVAQQEFEPIDVVNECDTVSGRRIGFSTRPSVFEMAKYVINNENSDYDTISAIVKTGCERILGRRAPSKSGEIGASAAGSTTSESDIRRRLDNHPIARLFQNETKREIVKFIVGEMDPECRYRTGQFENNITVSRESIRRFTNNLDDFVEMGLLDVATDDPNEAVTVFYERADTPVVEILRKNDNYEWLCEVFDSRSKQRIMAWFLTDWAYNINEPVSRNKIVQLTTISPSTVYDGLLETLTKADILVNVNDEGQYEPAHSERVDVIVRLEEALRTVSD